MSIHRLAETIAARGDADPDTSWTAKLLSRGPEKCAEKFGEEAVEAIIEGLAASGPGKVLVTTSGTAGMRSGEVATETDATDPRSVSAGRRTARRCGGNGAASAAGPVARTSKRAMTSPA